MQSVLFYAVDYVLAAMLYTLMGRLALSFFIPQNWDNYIWRAFVKLTDPAICAAHALTPRSTPLVLNLIFAILWLFLLRFFWLLLASWSGLAVVLFPEA